ncbi:MAG: hypothetical protein R3A46_21380 [Thermomicrobiales bacterium]
MPRRSARPVIFDRTKINQCRATPVKERPDDDDDDQQRPDRAPDGDEVGERISRLNQDDVDQEKDANQEPDIHPEQRHNRPADDERQLDARIELVEPRLAWFEEIEAGSRNAQPERPFPARAARS